MNTKKRLLALGLAFALIFNMVDVTTAAATAPEVTQTEEEQQIEEQTEEQKQEPAGDSLEEHEIEALESNTGITNVDTGLEDSEKKDSESDAAVAAVQEMINALPDVDTLDEMESDELEKAYADTQAAYEAYEALTEEQQAKLTGADCFEVLLDWFNGQVVLLADETAANVAEVNGTKYKTLAEAITAANGADITLLKTFGENVVVDNASIKAGIILGNGGTIEGEVTYPSNWMAMQGDTPPCIPLTMKGGEITLKDGALVQNGTGANANAAIALKGGTLIVESTVTEIAGGKVDENVRQSAIEATGGMLDLRGNTLLDGGLSISAAAQLQSKLTAGIFTNIGDGAARVSVEGDKYNTVFDLLATGYVFAKYENDATSEVIVKDDSTKKLTEDVAVIACTHKDADNKSLFKDGKCKACGFTCAHSKNNANQFKDGVCTVCGYVCPHTNVDPQTAVCTFCDANMVVKVVKDDTTTYYAEHHEAGYPYGEDTLKQVFNNAESGSTITLLADGLYAFGWATGKTITLDLNGKNLIENNGINAAKDNSNDVRGKLIVTGGGSSTTDSLYACTFRVIDGCELLFDDGFSGNYGTIYVEDGKLTSDSTNMTIGTLDIQNSGATVSLKGGTFGKICFSNSWGSVKAGALLALDNYGQISGKAFKYTAEDGAFVPYNTEITSSGVENVTIVDCPHDSIDDDGTCAYCGMTNITAVLTKPDGSIETYILNDDVIEPFGALTNNGGTLKLYSDLAYSYYLGTQDNTTTEMVIDLNGHKVTLPTGAENQEVVVNGGTLTITDSGSGKTGKFASPLSVYYAASLTVDGAAVGKIIANTADAKITLKTGTTFTDYQKPSGMMLADWLEEGNCISGGVDLTDTTNTSDSGSFAVANIPATITEREKEGTIPYGTDRLPNEIYPAIALDKNSPLNEDVSTLSWAWTFIVNGKTYTLFKGTYTEADGYLLGFDSPWKQDVISGGDKLNVTFTLSALTGNGSTAWSTVLTGYTLTVNKGTAFIPEVNKPTAVKNLTYTGSPQKLVMQQGEVDGGELQYSLDCTNYSVDIPAGTEAREYTVWYKAVGDRNHNDSQPQSLKVTIAPKTVDNPTIEVASCTYNGTAQKPNVTVKDGNRLIAPGEYTVSYSDNINAGENTAIVTITNKDGGNYTVSGSAKFSIAKADAPKLTDISRSQKYTVNTEKSVSLTDIGMPADAGTLNYTKGEESTTGSVTVSSWDVDNTGKVTYILTSGAVDDTVTLPVTIHSTNYADTTVNVVITLADKDAPEVKADNIEVTYNGVEISGGKITGTATFDGENVPGSWSWKPGQNLTHVGNSGNKTVIFTPEDKTNYKSVETEIQLKINPKTVTISNTTVASTKVYDGTKEAKITNYGYINGTLVQDILTIDTSQVKATYTDADAGTGKTVMFSGFALTGADRRDYVLSAQPTSVKADITPRELTMTGNVSAVDRAYEPGNTTVTLNSDSLTLSGMLGNETVNVSVHEGTMADADVGENKTVTCLPVLTDGEHGGKAINYKVVSMPAVTVNITKAAGSIIAPTAIGNLVYNGNQQTLIKAGSSVTGEVQYRLGENGTYSTALPVAKDVGTYTIYYKVVGDKNHEDMAEASLQVTIATQPSSGSHTDNTTESQPTESQPTESQPAVSTPETASAPTQPKAGSSHVNVPEADGIGATEQTKAQEPYVSGDAGKSGWDQIKDEIGAAIREVQTQNQQTEDSEPVTVTVNMNGTTVVPGEIFDSIKARNISVAFDMGNGITWTVNGMDITADQINDIDFGVSMGAEAGQSIPVDIINNVTGERYSMNLTLNYEGTFGFKAILTVNVEKTNAGLFANLFYYNQKSGELEFICADEIRADGSVDLTFTHASDYVVVVDKEPMDGTAADETVGAEEPAEETMADAVAQEPDSGQMNWLILLIIIALLAGTGAVLVWKSKEKKKEE